MNFILTSTSGKSLIEETTLLPDPKRLDLTTRFKKSADGIYIEAKRSAIGGITTVPLYFYVILLLLGWNEILAVLRNPLLFVFLAIAAAGAYVTNTLGLWGPIYQMTNAAAVQAVEEGKKWLREFLESSEAGRSMLEGQGQGEEIKLSKLDGRGKAQAEDEGEEI